MTDTKVGLHPQNTHSLEYRISKRPSQAWMPVPELFPTPHTSSFPLGSDPDLNIRWLWQLPEDFFPLHFMRGFRFQCGNKQELPVGVQPPCPRVQPGSDDKSGEEY